MDNPRGVVPNTTAKTIPNTGGRYRLAAGAGLLSGAPVVIGRCLEASR